MNPELPEKVYVVYRTPHVDDQRQRWGPLRRLYSRWADVRLYMSSNRRSTFKVYEGEVAWREIEPTDSA